MKSTALLLALVALAGTGKAFFGGGRRRAARPQREIPDLDLYAILGLDEDDAEPSDIKKAYRKLSLKHHPDKNGGKETEEYQKIQRAYEVLSSEETKYVYDFEGYRGVVEHEERAAQGDRGGGDMMGMFFGGQRRNGNQDPPSQMRFDAPLEDFYNGAVEKPSITRRVVCRGCNVKKNPNAKSKEKCQSCGRCPNEIRMVQRQMGPGFLVQQQEEVASDEKCKRERKTLEITVERGAPDGMEVKFPYAAEQSPGKIPGDVIVVLKQKKHPRFERREDQLHHKMRISLKEALTGFDKPLKHLDDREIRIKSPTDREGRHRVVKPFETLVYKNEGMPKHDVPSQFGDLHVTFEVVFPTSLTEEQVAKVNELF